MDDELRKLLDVLRCLVTILEAIDKLFPDWVGTFQEFEDELVERIQEFR